jgi:hypothetical protein
MWRNLSFITAAWPRLLEQESDYLTRCDLSYFRLKPAFHLASFTLLLSPSDRTFAATARIAMDEFTQCGQSDTYDAQHSAFQSTSALEVA